MNSKADVVIVGAGLAGLNCARELVRAGRSVAVLESSDGVGGRVRTDLVDGFRLDRGLQNYLSSYPEGKRALDLDALRLRHFAPALLVRYRGRFRRFARPRDEFWTAVKSAFGVPGTLRQKLRAGALPKLAAAIPPDAPDESAAAFLARSGVGDELTAAVFRPFLSAVFLEPELTTSARFLRFVYSNFATGRPSLPAAGMQVIPDQLAAALPPGAVRLNAPVAAVDAAGVTLATGERRAARAVVVATDGPAAARLLGGAIVEPGSNGTVTVYYAAPQSPLSQPVLAVDGDGGGPATAIAVLSDVAPEYAPPGLSLIAASVVGLPADGDDALDARIRAQLGGWFGPVVAGWRRLRVYRIPHALPAQPVAWLEPWQRPVRVRPGLFVCGDHRDNASIDGALGSGRRAAEAVLADLAASR